jgi:hypothetical protein
MMWRTRLTAAVALVCAAAAAVLLSACAGHAAGSARPSVRSMLAARADAVLHHDRAAFLATVDPDAHAFRAQQSRAFGNMTRLPLASWSYRLVSTRAFQVAGGGQVGTKVRLAYALRGYDLAPVTSDEYLTMVHRAGKWYISSQSGSDSAGDRTTAEMWDQGQMNVVTGERSLVIGHGSPASLRGYADLADRAVPVVRSAWPGKWAGRAILEVPGTEQDLAALLGGGSAKQYDGIAAVTTAELGGSGQMGADRVIVNPRAFAQLSAFGRRVVLTHEMTHVATDNATSGSTPVWMSEGFADLVGYTGTGESARQISPELRHDIATGHAPRHLPTSADFDPTNPALPQAYESGWLACRMVASTYGHAKLVALYEATGREGLNRALHDTLGLNPARFTARWHAYMMKELA